MPLCPPPKTASTSGTCWVSTCMVQLQHAVCAAQERYAPPSGQLVLDMGRVQDIVLLSIIMTAASEHDLVQLLLRCPGHGGDE